jgi:hypothetical protein
MAALGWEVGSPLANPEGAALGWEAGSPLGAEGSTLGWEANGCAVLDDFPPP